MTPSTPDAFARAVGKLADDCEAGLWKDDVAKLLRTHHAKIERLVRRMQQAENIEPGSVVGYRVALRHVAEALKEMRR